MLQPLSQIKFDQTRSDGNKNFHKLSGKNHFLNWAPLARRAFKASMGAKWTNLVVVSLLSIMILARCPEDTDSGSMVKIFFFKNRGHTTI